MHTIGALSKSFMHLFIYLFIYFIIYLFMYLLIHLFIYLYIHLCIPHYCETQRLTEIWGYPRPLLIECKQGEMVLMTEKGGGEKKRNESARILSP